MLTKTTKERTLTLVELSHLFHKIGMFSDSEKIQKIVINPPIEDDDEQSFTFTTYEVNTADATIL